MESDPELLLQDRLLRVEESLCVEHACKCCLLSEKIYYPMSQIKNATSPVSVLFLPVPSAVNELSQVK